MPELKAAAVDQAHADIIWGFDDRHVLVPVHCAAGVCEVRKKLALGLLTSACIL